MTFKKLVGYWLGLEKTASRNQMTEILAHLFQEAKVEEIAQVCYLSLGQLAPLFAGVEFNLAEKLMVKVLALAYQKNEVEIKQKYKSLGDLGDTAQFFDKKVKAKPLNVNEVFQKLWQIAKEGGEGSVERKIQKMAQLLADLDATSVRYVTRIPLGKLRLGFSDLTILDALSWMMVGNKSKRPSIEAAYNVRADVGQIAKLIKQKGLKGLRSLKVQLGTPIMPALCQRLPTAEEIIKKMDTVAVEPKYDGQRLAVHFSRGKLIRIFTRNLENVTPMFPDIALALPKEVKAKTFILDGEAIGFDPKNGKFLAFQETIKRKRKYQITAKVKEIPLKYFAFDVLFKDGQDLLALPFNQRRGILAKIISPENETIILSPQIVTDNFQKLRQYHDEQIDKGLEGVVVKKWSTSYEPGRRGFNWVKLKQEKTKKGGGLADTLDCIVMGYYSGKGKRASFGIGGFLVGVRQGEQIVTVSKIGTGLSDEQWKKLKAQGSNIEAQNKPKEYLVDKNLIPDVWCLPKIVVEIQADNITKSPIHTAGLALRFPRLIRFRDDKSPDQATTLQETKRLCELQK